MAEPVLTSEIQHDIVGELRERARNPDDRRAAAALLQQLAGRSDLDDDVADQVDQLLTTYATLDDRMSELMANLVGELSDMHCTPVLGTGLADSLLGSRRSLAQEWAKSVRFPMAPHQRDDLPQVAQYVAVTKSPNQVRRDLGRFYLDKLSASFDDLDEELAGANLEAQIKLAWRRHLDGQKVDPYAVLARLPIPVYVTTEWTTHLSDALETTDPPKLAIVEFCRWNPDVRRWPETSVPRGYVPDVQHPLVFHVFGKLDVPESLVITEDNFFDFLVSVAEDRSLIPLVVQEALSNSSLLFLGFGLEDWDVRVLLRSLINREVAERLRRNFKHVAAQLDSRDWLNAERGSRVSGGVLQELSGPSDRHLLGDGRAVHGRAGECVGTRGAPPMTAVDTTAPGVRAGNPYVGPRSFVEGEKLYGRDREIDELRSTLLA